jgi:hypothetical protein
MCTGNMTLRLVSVNTVGGKGIRITYSECVCVYVCVALVIRHAMYCHLWPVRLYRIFRHSVTNDAIFIIARKMCFGFLWNFWNFSRSEKNWARYHKCISVFMQSTRYSCQILMKLEFFSTDFRKILKCQISWKSFQFASHFLVRTLILNCSKIRSVLLEVMQASRLTRPPYGAFILCTVGTKCVELEQEVTPKEGHYDRFRCQLSLY